VAAAARRKPVIASFGRIAASGGYYVGAGAREIFAPSSCLTGSIGIFYGKADVANLLGRLDVHVELTRRGDRADIDSIFRPYTPEERRFLADKIGEFYTLFVSRVAAGRHRTPAEIDALGEGRVWSGTRAREVGLVDRVGGFMAALERARTLAGLGEDYELIELPAEGGGVLQAVARMLVHESTPVPSLAAQVLSSPEARAPVGWLLSVAAGTGTPMAMTDWPVLVP
jgi:protease-4